MKTFPVANPLDPLCLFRCRDAGRFHNYIFLGDTGFQEELLPHFRFGRRVFSHTTGADDFIGNPFVVKLSGSREPVSEDMRRLSAGPNRRTENDNAISVSYGCKRIPSPKINELVGDINDEGGDERNEK